MRSRTIIFSNQKGGVGKTTLTREIGLTLGSGGKRVLLVDCDPQGNLTKSLVDSTNGAAGSADRGLYDALCDAGGIRITELGEHLSLLAGDFRLSLLEKSLIGEIDAYTRLKGLLADSRLDSYELVLLDTPPSLGVLTVNALAAATDLVIPMNPSLYSMQGTNDLLRTVSKVRSSLNPALSLLGVIVNAYDSVPVITRQIRTEIQGAFGDKVFATVLSKSIRLEEAIATHRGVIQHASSHKVADEVRALAAELVQRLEGGLQ